ncbi:hypothetical protein GU833_03715 [Photorhabdus akhurstii]|uniref:Uncharacterized protein n=2 Tax=Morganellaceae TaxID=1903414 RepID=A0A0A0CTG1_9GAMM|nr:hypothetical protein KS18_02325 [Photorhabdus luminescens]MBS9427270.1 hypothetical protein [Photorhabdus akhurstii]MBS9432110.1 hypothetical protein [Photorhabdus hainanensis]MCC8457315.1 hypothetical protein [Photorhabdus aegyptia]PQQ26535.1 hypothetical protein C6H66_10220 [Photorhabdus hindustanensis]
MIMGILTGNDIPIPGKSYIIHPYPAGDYATAVTVASIFHAVPGSVSLAIWESNTLHQKFECVWHGGYLGFICRASPVSDQGAYLGYDAHETLICKAQYQQKWEDMVVIKRPSGGFEWCMRKDDHLAFVGVQGHIQLKIFKDFTGTWGFTEWL